MSDVLHRSPLPLVDYGASHSHRQMHEIRLIVFRIMDPPYRLTGLQPIDRAARLMSVEDGNVCAIYRPNVDCPPDGRE
jgi:hypothetical protein